MTGIVIDAAVALAWVFPDEHNAAADAILESLEHQAVVVPGHWSVEVAAALAAGEQTGRITGARVQRFVTLLETLNVVEYACEPASAVGRRGSLCRDYGLTAYNAAYLDLAMREDLPLATFDSRLRRAARKAGVTLLGDA